MDTDNMSPIVAVTICAGLANDAERILREGDITGCLAKELELVRVGEVWEMRFFGTPVTIVSFTGKTADDTVTFSRRGEEETLLLPVFLGATLHPSLEEENDDKETTTTQTKPTEQDETPDFLNNPEPKTFGFTKARKLLKRAYILTRPKWDFSILYYGEDLVAVGKDTGPEVYELTAEDIFADDWQWG